MSNIYAVRNFCKYDPNREYLKTWDIRISQSSIGSWDYYYTYMQYIRQVQNARNLHCRIETTQAWAYCDTQQPQLTPGILQSHYAYRYVR